MHCRRRQRGYSESSKQFLRDKHSSDRADFFTIVFSALDTPQNHPVPDIDQQVRPFDPHGLSPPGGGENDLLDWASDPTFRCISTC